MCQYVVVDLEMCKVPKEKRLSFKWPSETIQIGAVLMNDRFEITDKFNSYVKPEYGNLEHFISQLTGITAQDLKGAPLMEEALKAFLLWVPKDSIIVSWSDSDLLQVKHEVEFKKIECERMDDLCERWVDAQKLFSEKINDERPYRLSDALLMTDILQEGKEHDGLVDAINTAKLYAKMMTETKLEIKHYSQNARTVYAEECSFTMGSLFKNIVVA